MRKWRGAGILEFCGKCIGSYASQLALSCKARLWLTFVENSPTYNCHLVDNEHVSKCLNFLSLHLYFLRAAA